MLHKCVLLPHIHMCGEEHKDRETVTFPSATIQLKDRILFRLQIFSALPAKDIKYIHIVTVSGLAEVCWAYCFLMFLLSFQSNAV